MGERRHTILVVDDNPDLLDLLRDGLSDHFTLRMAADGADALISVDEAQPDCAIIDLKMPRVDGLQLIRTLRGDPATANIPLIILTALPEEQGQLPGLLSGADYYLTKPVLPSELIPAIHEAITIGQGDRQRRMRSLAEEGGR